MIKTFLLIACSFSLIWSQDRAVSDYDSEAMIAAIDESRGTVDKLLQLVKTGKVTKYNIKAKVVDKHGTEHFWLTGVSFANGVFSGRVDNDPNVVKSVRLGDVVKVKKGEISDWMYIDEGMIHGNRTLRVLLPTMDKSEAEKIAQILAPLD